MPREQKSPHPLLSARWVIGLAIMVSATVLVHSLVTVLVSDRPVRIGDGKSVASYGFDLTTCLVPREGIAAGGLPKDGLAALTLPRLLTVDQVDSLNRAERGKYLVSNDRVIGVVIGGVPRAYPLRVLNWHEIVNDTLGGRPIAVTYSPLCDGCAVFNRLVAGEVLEFGFSGLLASSNLLMYDRRGDGQRESLWSQLQARAVAGPAAAHGQQLTLLPAAVASWADWKAWYPETTVPFPDPEHRASYKREPYLTYYGSDRLRFPVVPLPPPDGPPLKERIVAVRAGQEWAVFPLSAVAVGEPVTRHWTASSDSMHVWRFVCQKDPATVVVFKGDAVQLVPSILCFWFAWYSAHPEHSGLLP
jgi:hypothetical protein